MCFLLVILQSLQFGHEASAHELATLVDGLLYAAQLGLRALGEACLLVSLGQMLNAQILIVGSELEQLTLVTGKFGWFRFLIARIEMPFGRMCERCECA